MPDRALSLVPPLARAIGSIGVVGHSAAGSRIAEAARAAGIDVVPAGFDDVDVLVEGAAGALAEYSGTGLLVTTSVTLPVSAVAPSGAEDRTVGLRVGWGGTGVELAIPDAVAPWARERARDLVDLLGFPVVEAGDRPVSFELVLGLLNAAAGMVGYVDAAAVDLAMRVGCGLPWGPLRLLDAIVEGVPSGPLPEPAKPVWGAEKTVRRVGIVGTGVMATGIAQAFVSAGIAVAQVGRSGDRVAAVRDAVDWHVARTGVDEPGHWVGGTDLDLVADCDLVVEAVVEDAEVKRSLFADLAAVCGPGVVLATTTSALPVTACAEATGSPETVVGLHFFNPAATMPLVEVVRTAHTGDRALAVAREVCGRLGKHAVECGDRPGFVVNALLFPYLNNALRLVEPAEIDQVDAAMRAVHGFPMGPAKLLDLVGLDVAARVVEGLGDTPAPLLVEAVAGGYLGRKTRRGIRDLARELTSPERTPR
ncbi:3-hydroxyacyl-CoA dehydrogenase family protein [Actinokineospora inagensis]|uniref:3-hydroxyacyl-CoA dehydrogenase family protein n=1 Tax=Actinokineospora inagensis TaxID=103730 RepID=UPI00040E3C70|nr:3-hydroxyacyl-CoA dehydrogenase family protein [Actinokineospora inagensis]